VVGPAGVGVGDGFIGVGVGVLRFGVDTGAAKILPTSVQIPCHESTIVYWATSEVAAHAAHESTALSKILGSQSPASS
jgi:hypothetical protein